MTTNYMKIKNMSVEEMARFLTKTTLFASKCHYDTTPEAILKYKNDCVQWLNQEVEE